LVTSPTIAAPVELRVDVHELRDVDDVAIVGTEGGDRPASRARRRRPVVDVDRAPLL